LNQEEDSYPSFMYLLAHKNVPHCTISESGKDQQKRSSNAKSLPEHQLLGRVRKLAFTLHREPTNATSFPNAHDQYSFTAKESHMLSKSNYEKSAMLFLMAISLSAFLTLSSCTKENTLEPATTSQISANADAAESIASTVGEENGGLTDQMGDLFDLTSPTGLSKSEDASYLDKKEATYDSVTGIWTVVLERERGQVNGMNYAFIKRTYTFQFLNKNGQPQKFYVVNGDTANTIKFNIVEGEGRHKTKRLSQELKTLEGSFVATGTNTDMITVNGTYKRAAADTITTMRFTRTHDHQTELSIINLKGPRGSRRNLSQKVSGTITGTYHAVITFDGIKGYSERTIDKTINIVIGEGESQINIAGQKYLGDLASGEMK